MLWVNVMFYLCYFVSIHVRHVCAYIDLTRTVCVVLLTNKWLVINFIFRPLTIGQPNKNWKPQKWYSVTKVMQLHIEIHPPRVTKRSVSERNNVNVIHWNWLTKRERTCARKGRKRMGEKEKKRKTQSKYKAESSILMWFFGMWQMKKVWKRKILNFVKYQKRN